MTALRGAAKTDIGRVRSVNQDGALTSPYLVAVADGMGGHRAGEVASALALRSLASHERFRTLAEVVDAVRRANGAIFEAAAKEPELRGMGTTLCALAVVDPEGPGERLALVNVGDSRAYQVRDGGLAQLTVDHSLVQLMVEEGQLRPDEAESHPQRNILTRALGIEADVAVDGWQLDAVAGQRFLICSDGLFNEVEPGRIAATLRTYADPGEAARVLVGLANAAGGRDNVTCVVVDVVESPEAAAGISEEAAGAVDASRPDRPQADASRPDRARADTSGSADATRAPGGAGRSDGAGSGAPGGDDENERSGGGRHRARPVGAADAPDRSGGGRRPGRSTVATAEQPSVAPVPSGPGGATAPDPTTTAVTTLAAHQRFDEGTVDDHPRPRRVTFRVVVFVVAALAVLAVAGLAIGWFATRTYFVGFEGEQVVIFRGRPGGLLWMDPSVAESPQPPLSRAGLVEALCNRVEGQPSATDLGDARRVVEQLRADQAALPAPNSPCGAAA